MVVDLDHLLEKLDQNLHKFKSRKQLDKSRAMTGHYGIKSKVAESDLMDETASISKELLVADKDAKMTEIKNKNLKNEIMRIKKRLETAFDLETITKIENDIKVCEDQIF
jgi:hypothetical protein